MSAAPGAGERTAEGWAERQRPARQAAQRWAIKLEMARLRSQAAEMDRLRGNCEARMAAARGEEQA